NNGYFSSNSVIKKVYREGVVLLSGGRAILLQLAHPFVAAGVDDYSNFQAEILKRLYRTLSFMQNLVFEDRRRARAALQHFHALHEKIRGRLPHDAGRFPAGTPYSGTDPDAKLWVHATFVDTSLKVYERFISPLTMNERRSFYTDTLVLARLMEIPDEILPQTLEDFDNYMKSALSGDTLAVTGTAKRLANAVLYPRVGFLPSISAGLLRLVTAGILPERFQREFGLKWNRTRQFALNGFAFLIRSLRPVVPPWIWQNPLLKGKLTYFLLWGKHTSNK
ncbi:MAG: oxygenase MpaB family protein, partial [Calditrichaceae bacterium]